MSNAPQPKQNIFSKETLLPVGLVLGICYGAFIAGGFFEQAKAVDKLDLPNQLARINAVLASQASDINAIKRRLGLGGSYDPTSSGPHIGPQQLLSPQPTPRRAAAYPE